MTQDEPKWRIHTCQKGYKHWYKSWGKNKGSCAACCNILIDAQLKPDWNQENWPAYAKHSSDASCCKTDIQGAFEVLLIDSIFLFLEDKSKFLFSDISESMFHEDVPGVKIANENKNGDSQVTLPSTSR